jgi:hypothetical protein
MYEVSLYKSFQWFSNFTPNFDLFEGLDSLESEEIMFRRKNTPLFNASDAEQREAKVFFLKCFCYFAELLSCKVNDLK